MRRDPLFEECLADILREKKMTQREFASFMGKKESEISRWLTGSHGFTTKNPRQEPITSWRGF